MFLSIRQIVIVIVSIFFLIACGGDSNSSNSSVKTVKLVDIPIGIDYETDSAEGVTTSDGILSYNDSDSDITFKIGKLTIAIFKLSNLNSDRNILLTDLAGVARTETTNSDLIKLLRLLQSLDKDDNPDNGIEITTDTKNLITDEVNVKDLSNSEMSNIVESTGKTLNTEVTNNMSGDVVYYIPIKPTIKVIPVTTSINTTDVLVVGEPGASIFVNMIDTNKTIGDDGTIISLNTDALIGEKNSFSITSKSGNLTMSEALEFTILKVDSNKPVFNSLSTISVNENQTNALTLSAQDLSTLVYSIEGTDADFFNVNENTGVVTFKTAPDYETKKSYSFIAKAEDSNGNFEVQNININILDVFDDKIRFITPSIISFDEKFVNQSFDILVEYSRSLTYVIEGIDKDKFSINQSGTLSLVGIADYETKNSYSISVKVTDNLNNSETQDLTININDIDESLFITKWKTDNEGLSEDNQIKITTYPILTTYNFTVDWGDGTSDSNVTEDITHTYEKAGTYRISIGGDFPKLYIYSHVKNTNDNTKLISVEQWGDQKWESLSFMGCSNLETINDTLSPDLSSLTGLNQIFRYASKFNADLSSWDISNITDLDRAFADTDSFNGNISSWDTSNVTSMTSMFNNAKSFNRDISSWDTSNVTSMSGMFMETEVFNQNLSSWDTSNVTSFSQMFWGADSFNGDISSWDTSNATSLFGMFFEAKEFNNDISSWDTSNVTNMRYLFYRANSFNQDLSSWNISMVNTMVSLFSNTSLSSSNYDEILNSWAIQNVQSDVELGANGVYYTHESELSRNILIHDNNWTITDEGKITF